MGRIFVCALLVGCICFGILMGTTLVSLFPTSTRSFSSVSAVSAASTSEAQSFGLRMFAAPTVVNNYHEQGKGNEQTIAATLVKVQNSDRLASTLPRHPISDIRHLEELNELYYMDQIQERKQRRNEIYGRIGANYACLGGVIPIGLSTASSVKDGHKYGESAGVFSVCVISKLCER
jgi:hypothetical protein